MPRLSLQRALLIIPLLGGIRMPPAVAHDVQIADDVGATLHIEPNDIARAGEPTDLWFALTQAGGTVIPLENCDCKLTLYDLQNTVVVSPALTPVSAEGFQDIPGATVTFPDVGAYELVLTGQPQSAEQFSDFELRFAVIVASRGAGTPPPRATEEAASPDSELADGDVTTAPADELAGAVAPTSETPAPNSTSSLGIVAAIVGGAVVVIGLAIARISGRRSPGEKE